MIEIVREDLRKELAFEAPSAPPVAELPPIDGEQLLWKTIWGSQLWGMASPDSDTDTCSVYRLDHETLAPARRLPPRTGWHRKTDAGDDHYYELEHAVQLVLKGSLTLLLGVMSPLVVSASSTAHAELRGLLEASPSRICCRALLRDVRDSERAMARARERAHYFKHLRYRSDLTVARSTTICLDGAADTIEERVMPSVFSSNPRRHEIALTDRALAALCTDASARFDELPLAHRGHSAEIRRTAVPGILIQRLIPSLNSISRRRRGSVEGMARLRHEISRGLLARWHAAGLATCHLACDDDGMLISEERVPPIEVIVKAALIGTPARIYHGLFEHTDRFGHPITRHAAHEPYVRFDYRNPLHDPSAPA